MPMYKLKPQPYKYELSIGNKKIQTNLHFFNRILSKMMRGYSPIICICGEQRNGKSFIGVWLAYLIMTAFGKKIDWNRNSAYDPVETSTKLMDIEKEVFMLDEASSSFHKREWYKRINIAFSKIIITQGRKVICYIFISPFVNDIDKTFTKHFDFIVRVQTRGKIRVFRVKKKYDQLNENRSTYYMHQDDVSVRMKDVPTHLWKQYQKFSNDEKDRIERTIMQDNITTQTPEQLKSDIKSILRRI